MSADTPAGPQSGASFGGRNFAPAGYTPGAVVPNGGGGGGGPATRGGSPGSVAPNSKSTGPQVKRFGMGKALAAGGLAAGAYGAYKAVPWAANKMDEANSTPMAKVCLAWVLAKRFPLGEPCSQPSVLGGTSPQPVFGQV